MVIAAFKKEIKIKHTEVAACQSFHSPFPGKGPSFCPSFCPDCEPLEGAASHGRYKHARAHELQFPKTSSLQSILERLRPTNTPLAQSNRKCFCFICNLT